MLLTVAVPTYNRVKYLSELLPILIAECQKAYELGFAVELLVSDNASTDGTERLARQRLSEYQFSRYYRNESNIGGDRNFIECIGRATGTYVWLFGDDEILADGAILKLCRLLTKHSPTLLIAKSGRHKTKVYETYRDAVEGNLPLKMTFPIDHTLITSNVFRKADFLRDEAIARLKTNYAHMYAMIPALSRRNSRTVVVSQSRALFDVRKHRASFDETPVNLEEKLLEYCHTLALGIDSAMLRYTTRFFFSVYNPYILGRISRAKCGLKYSIRFCFARIGIASPI